MATLIKKIKVKGFLKFEKDISLSFETNKNKYNLKGIVREIDNMEYNPVLGIIGANSGGKTTAATIILAYAKFLRHGFLVQESGNSFASVNTFYNYINKNSNEIKLSVSLSIDGEELIHEITTNLEEGSTESVIFKGAKYIFDEKTEKHAGSFIQKYLWRDPLENEQTKKLVEAANELSKLGKSIMGVHSEVNSSLDDYMFNYYYKEIDKNANNEKLSRILESILVLDPLVKSIKLEKNFIHDTYSFMNMPIKLKNNSKIKYMELSTGTKKFFMLLFRIFLHEEISKKEKNYLYIMIDEIDNSWHPNLVRSFINLFKMNIYENCFLVFTAHNPYLMDYMRKDSIYILKENELKNYSKLKINEKNVRDDLKFSKSYLDSVFFDDDEVGLEKLSEYIEKI